MVAVRAFLAALIAVSVALVPAAGGAVASATMTVEISVPDHADAPCCPPDDCKGSVACALKCFNFSGAVLSAMIVSPPFTVEAAPLSLTDDVLHAHVSAPPTHPPPV